MVTVLINQLPENQFVDWPDSLQELTAKEPSSSTHTMEVARIIILELVETDRKYVQDLEFIQVHAFTLTDPLNLI
jgi:hypothetical protein